MIFSRNKQSSGFTLMEVILTIVIALIVLLGLSVVMADMQKGWNKMYRRVNSDAVSAGLVAKIKFDDIIRKSSRTKFLIDASGAWVEVYYYDNLASVEPDRYARLYTSGKQLLIEHGEADPRTALSKELVCENVQQCIFAASSGAVHMKLNLDDGDNAVEVVSAAIMHNE